MIRLLIFLFTSLCCYFTQAQFIFTNLQSKDGLSSKDVYSVIQDTEGFMWFGTVNGLNRYDGSTFKIFNRANSNFPAGSSEDITSITEFGKGKIWIGTRAGLLVYDKLTGKFTPITLPGATGEDSRIEKVIVDSKKRLWVLAARAVFIMNDTMPVPLKNIYPSAAGVGGFLVFGSSTISDPYRKAMWIGSEKGLHCIDFNSGETWSSKSNPRNWKIFSDKSVQSVALDKAGNMWFSDAINTLSYFNFNTNTVTPTEVNANGQRWQMGGGSHRLFVDSKNRLWVSSWHHLTFVRSVDGTFRVLPIESTQPFSMTYGFFHDLWEDKDHNLWLAGLNGINILVSNSYLADIRDITPPRQDSAIVMPSNNLQPPINIFTKTADKQWLIGKDDGLFLWNENSAKPERYMIDRQTYHGNRVFEINKINGQWWIGSGYGVKIFDSVKKTFSDLKTVTKSATEKSVNLKNSVLWIQQDRRGFIWFTTWIDALFRYDPRTKETTYFRSLDGDTSDHKRRNYLSFLEDHTGQIWIAYSDQGLRIYDPSDDKFHKPAPGLLHTPGLIVNDMMEDSDHNIWVSTNQKGLLKCRADGSCIDSFSTADGLSLMNVSNIFQDSYGRIWMSTGEGVHYLEKGSHRIHKLGIDIGFSLNECWSYFMQDGNMLYLSMLHKMAVVDLTKLHGSSLVSPPLISRVSIFESEVPFSAIDPNINLRYDQNFFVVEFSSLHHNELSSLQYAYKLEGFDKDWVYCGSRQTAAYTNVPGGRYTFKVKSADSNGVWSDKITSINIRIGYPFWKTWWFLSLVAIAVLLALWWLINRRSQQKQKLKIDKTIDYFANSVYGENSVNEICWDIARNCISQLEFEDCVVYLLDDQKKKMVQRAAFGPKNPKGHEIVNPLEIPMGKGIVGTVAATGKPLLINDTTKDVRYIVDDERRYSELAVPIVHDNRVIGVIDSENSKRNYFTPAHLKALSIIASISANKIAEAKAEATSRSNELKLLEINRMLAESQLMALRAQMNPHFVFNCLNSIQECIVTHKYGEASKYLNKFSKLFRMVLNNSGDSLVTIDDEKEVLSLYLELEVMRFEKSFEYEIKVDESLETDEILVPSMLLQPYVENALWHGLMHKDGERKLLIEFKRVNEEIFQCIIDDNGIGRQRSFELKEQQSKAKHHVSKGMRISKDRLNLLQLQNQHATIEIIDKMNGEGQPAGTKVLIELSTYLKN